ncbi:MAG: cob(I)yrinic acid a,c-diamide adenosyltransferase [Candidatus Poseidoniales archaeon]|jgi:cob(I)alamin adenosyltransferase|nr:ATP:cob(I)alamin adenosyltransferase [Euryarchaeota archaeon]MDC0155915.1 cob(I)yrinic acid a,c-diamide adenosyltransferase [Euryarchaeota archaeon]MDC0555210.1 cob(I)yrinic acid a,c-diamide adenosyltransferase [Euryarchaeota archaeon]RCH73139.1 MAG: cob(I)yrinic acid a,c-diamide adenosyltransferase [Candidatus Poseidoniales archaeon]RCH73513.1 MAG: cob(I)yrinic acid a,c-diamide adenosyltransferase [Candidatus Poseidoniales archaeon]|tara:strand:+ start:2134 stop:2721 length:588 start_codon:yes stop_codon:yes gene_type:complete
MVRITKVHTGGGDGGETSLVDGSRVGKEHPRVAIYGTIDEANSAIGIVRAEMNRTDVIGIPNKRLIEANQMLSIIQQELFDVGAECACPPGGVPEQMSIIGTDAGERLVNEMDYMLEDLEPLSSFILPTGNPIVAHLHMARTIVRRAERDACTLREEVRHEVISYLNRLSDHCFVLSRWLTGEEGETLWTPLGKR